MSKVGTRSRFAVGEPSSTRSPFDTKETNHRIDDAEKRSRFASGPARLYINTQKLYDSGYRGGRKVRSGKVNKVGKNQ